MELSALIKKIDTLQQELAGYQPLPADAQQKLDKKFRLEFNYNSNHIEGNTLTYGETELYLIFDKTTGNHEGREYEEMRASDVALKMIQEHAADKEIPLTEKFIKNLNELILVKPYWVDAITPDGQPTRRQIFIGNYKKQPNSVRLQNGEMFHYTSPEDTPIKMGELVQWYRDELEKKELHPIQLAALLHYKFVLIHPFDDGNGRISRLLMNYVLYYHGLPPVIIKSANKKDYLFALNQADTGNVEAFASYIAAQMIWSLETSIKAAKGESIEEQDDLEKEIAVWKRKAVLTQINSVHRNNDIVYELYRKCFKDLFKLFFDRHRPFLDMFKDVKLGGFKNHNGQYDIDWLDKEMTLPTSILTDPLENAPADTFINLYAIVYLGEYKHMETDTFAINSSLQINFDPYRYKIEIAYGKFLMEKKYDEVLLHEECEQIVSTAIKHIFSEIKSKSKT